MKKSLLFFLATFSILSSGTVEWIGCGDTGILPEPPKEYNPNAGFMEQFQWRLAKRGWILLTPGGKVGRGNVMVFSNWPGMGFWTHHNLMRNPVKKILISWEPPTVVPENHDPNFHKFFQKIITWNTKLIDGNKYLQLCYPVFYPMQKNLPTFRERELVCMILADKSSNHPKELYSERRRVIYFYEHNPHLSFHLHGTGWEKYQLRNFISSPRIKCDVLAKYRFSYAYENYRNDEGYVTEKIFDCLHTGTVPIYLGASNVTDFVPANCFIDARNFSSYAALHEFIENMDEEQWLWYQDNIRRFLETPTAKLFTHKTLLDSLEKAIFD